MSIIFPLLILIIGLILHFSDGITRANFKALGIPTYFAGLLFICYIYAPQIIEVLKTHR